MPPLPRKISLEPRSWAARMRSRSGFKRAPRISSRISAQVARYPFLNSSNEADERKIDSVLGGSWPIFQPNYMESAQGGQRDSAGVAPRATLRENWRNGLQSPVCLSEHPDADSGSDRD